MTALQIKKALIAGGIDMNTIEDISRDSFTVCVIDPETGRADHDLTEEALQKATSVLSWGGFQTGWGAWMLKRDHQSDPYSGTPYSREHY